MLNDNFNKSIFLGMITFQELIRRLSQFWEKQGCIIHQGYDLELGAGTFNPATFLRCLGPEPYKAAYVEPSRRPTDGRYGTNPNRLQHYFQFQVILKPSPPDIQNVYLQSLEAVGFNLKEHDIRFVHDDWEAPTQGAWGLGWEAWLNGMEITQITYFQCIGGINVKPVTGEITYGLERLAMYLQNVDNVYDLQWNEHLTYGDIYHRNEVEWSAYNFEQANVELWHQHFKDYEEEAKKLIALKLPLPAYDFVIKASHAFNMLDARGVISVTERTGYIGRIRNLAMGIAKCYMESRETLGHPLMNKFPHKTQELPIVTPAMHAAVDKEEDFLLEIGSEELPSTFVPIGMKNLEKVIKQFLEKEKISYETIHFYGTPRRLSMIIEKLASHRKEEKIEKKGPPITQIFDEKGLPKPSSEGFFHSVNQEPISLEDIRTGKNPHLEIRKIKDLEYLFSILTTPKKSTFDLLSSHLPELILSIDFPKKMRWADLEISYARPILWIVALLGKTVVPFSIGNISTSNQSYGHRQLHPEPFTLSSPSEYLSLLRKRRVLVDVEERKASICLQLDALEKELNAKVIARERTLPEVLYLVEWPFVTFSHFDAAFLKAPKELLISEMVEHQKYFPVTDSQGHLKNMFVITANNTPSDQIRKGNQKVLSARLSDGVFLYEQDLKAPLETFNQKLAHITFQNDLGTVFDKVNRLIAHVRALHQVLKIGNLQQAERAALLCKADLASSVVYEFPDLQGIMGKTYALVQGEDKDVASAIEEHWMPRGENAPLPKTSCGILLSLADKIDNLLGCFAVGLKPTSSSDPYALRRQVLGMIKILIKNQLYLPLDIFKQCLNHFPKELQTNPSLTEEIEQFIINRVKTVFQDYGLSKDAIEASVSFGIQDIYDAFLRVQALDNFRQSNQQFPLLYEVYKRAKGQLETYSTSSYSPSLLQEPAEKELDSLLNSLKSPFEQALASKNYDQAYSLISTLQPALHQFFDKVKILSDDPNLRNNRTALLQIVFNLFSKLLDFKWLKATKSSTQEQEAPIPK